MKEIIIDRDQLNRELHARPELTFSVPSRCLHILMRCPEERERGCRKDFDSWRELLEVQQPDPEARFHLARDGFRQLSWEEHTETHAWTLVDERQSNVPFEAPLSELLPAAIKDRLAEYLMTGIRVEAIDEQELDGLNPYEWAKGILNSDQLTGGWMSDRHASVWTTYQPDPDGLIRFVIIGHDLSAGRLGRLVHRLSDIDDYRMMALLGLPHARRVMQVLNRIEPQLDSIMERLAKRPGGDEQAQLLAEISTLSARVEHLITRSTYRFSASRAYWAIVEQRFASIREEVQDGHQRLTVFLSKTLNPAMRTCEAADARARSMAARITRATHVLNTLVDLINKKQNQSILKSMEQQARMQVALQMAVEGLSIVAISYYGTGLVNYGLKSLKSLGFAIDPTLLTGIAIPVVVLLTWTGVRMAKKKLLAIGDRH